MTSSSPASTLRRRAGSPSRDSPVADDEQQQQRQPVKTSRTAADLIADHPSIRPLITPAPASSSSEKADQTSTAPRNATTAPSPTILSRIVNILFKPMFFLIFVILHLGNELGRSIRTMKMLLQVFFLPHLFPVAPELVRIVRKDVGDDLAKKPVHLAIITQKSGVTLTGEIDETEEDEWHARVTQLAQWSTAVGIKTLSIMRDAKIHPLALESLQERINHSMAEFYKEEKDVPVVLVRTMRPIEDSLSLVLQQQSNGISQESVLQRDQRLHGGRRFDLDVVILSPEDGPDRLSRNTRLLGKAALRDQITSKDITYDFLDQELSAELSEPELMMILKDDLDMSSYPTWQIRLTEIYHQPDQAVIPVYTMFLQALHRYAKCEQRFGA